MLCPAELRAQVRLRVQALTRRLEDAKTRRHTRSGREDLNLRHPAPKAGALPGCATPRTRLLQSPKLHEEFLDLGVQQILYLVSS